MWASDFAKLEEAYTRGDAEVLVFGRKYVVNMKVNALDSRVKARVPIS